MALEEARSDHEAALKGARVLIVEDEYYIADDLRRILENAGAHVIGPVPTLKAAHAALDDGGFDCAVIDLNLRGESAVEIADQLQEQGQRFVIATGYDSAIVPEGLNAVPRIEKPFDAKALLPLIGELSRR